MKPSRVGLFYVACVFAVTGLLSAAEETLDINIRTTVEVPKGQSIGEHPTFIMYPAVEVAAAYKLEHPVPPKTVEAAHRLIQEKLQAQGYVPVADKQRPQVLITIQYGRGYLPNPYATGLARADASGGNVVSVVGLPDMKRYEVEREAKRQFAAEEKLFFTVAAWDFASMQQGAKRVRYWTTTMIVDDPDHRDLNGIYRQMIAAGAKYFNRRIDREEVAVPTAIREGRVEVGTPNVVDDTKAKK